MSNRVNKIISIFAEYKNNLKNSFATENKTTFITKELFLQNLTGRGKKETADIPRVTASVKK